MASAPWTRAQFESKGVDALLEAARRMPDLRLTFLWRGILLKDMLRRVRRSGFEDRVSVINEYVDINSVLAGVHATVNLASDPGIVKAQPHSLLESLAAGRPVLVSRAIPISTYVEETDVGTVIEDLSPEAILRAIESLRNHYEASQRAAVSHGRTDFSLESMLGSFADVYETVIGGRHDRAKPGTLRHGEDLET